MTVKPPFAAPVPPDPTVAVAARFVVSGALLAVYFMSYGWLIEFLTRALQSVVTIEPSSPAPRVIAVTLLGSALVAVWWKLIKKDVRFHAPILITYILAIGDAMYGILENHTSDWLTQLTGGRVTGYSPTFVAIVATVLWDMALSRFTRGKWPHLSSAYIS